MSFVPPYYQQLQQSTFRYNNLYTENYQFSVQFTDYIVNNKSVATKIDLEPNDINGLYFSRFFTNELLIDYHVGNKTITQSLPQTIQTLSGILRNICDGKTTHTLQTKLFPTYLNVEFQESIKSTFNEHIVTLFSMSFQKVRGNQNVGFPNVIPHNDTQFGPGHSAAVPGFSSSARPPFVPAPPPFVPRNVDTHVVNELNWFKNKVAVLEETVKDKDKKVQEYKKKLSNVTKECLSKDDEIAEIIKHFKAEREMIKNELNECKQDFAIACLEKKELQLKIDKLIDEISYFEEKDNESNSFITFESDDLNKWHEIEKPFESEMNKVVENFDKIILSNQNPKSVSKKQMDYVAADPQAQMDIVNDILARFSKENLKNLRSVLKKN